MTRPRDASGTERRAESERDRSARAVIVGAIVVVLLVGALAWRIVVIRGTPALTNGPRAAEQTYLRLIGERVEQYAHTYRRPAYSLDSATAHLDSTNARLVRDLEKDLWGHPVEYAWTRCGFMLWSSGGAASSADSSAAQQVRITERFTWPPGVSADSSCG